MPRYKKDINIIVTKEMANEMMRRASCFRDRFIVAILYVTGARPDEICLMKKQDIKENNDDLDIKLHTSKLGKSDRFLIRERILTIKSSMPYFELIRNYWIKSPVETLVDLTVRRIEQIIEKLSDDKLCPYNFRHSRLTKLARRGASVDQLMYWKGAKSIKSVEPYLRAKKVVFDKIE